jgi:hypothetical protein
MKLKVKHTDAHLEGLGGREEAGEIHLINNNLHRIMIVPTLRNAPLQINPGKDNRRGQECEETFVTGVSKPLLASWCVDSGFEKIKYQFFQLILKLKVNERYECIS